MTMWHNLKELFNPDARRLVVALALAYLALGCRGGIWLWKYGFPVGCLYVRGSGFVTLEVAWWALAVDLLFWYAAACGLVLAGDRLRSGLGSARRRWALWGGVMGLYPAILAGLAVRLILDLAKFGVPTGLHLLLGLAGEIDTPATPISFAAWMADVSFWVFLAFAPVTALAGAALAAWLPAGRRARWTPWIGAAAGLLAACLGLALSYPLVRWQVGARKARAAPPRETYPATSS